MIEMGMWAKAIILTHVGVVQLTDRCIFYEYYIIRNLKEFIINASRPFGEI
jgi:hypothetical protein